MDKMRNTRIRCIFFCLQIDRAGQINMGPNIARSLKS